MNTVVLEFQAAPIVLEFEESSLSLAVVESPVIIELSGGGTLLAPDIVAALNAADEPSADNPFATLGDLGSQGGYARHFMLSG